jgi:hypothetical protein
MLYILSTPLRCAGLAVCVEGSPRVVSASPNIARPVMHSVSSSALKEFLRF